MGRKKGYDRESLIAKAMAVFRERGYAGTSTQALVDELGVNRNSLYSEFGSKEALFIEALRRYDNEVLSPRFGPLEQPTAGLSEVRNLLLHYREAADGQAAGLGCLLCNTAVEFADREPGDDRIVEAYFERLSGAFLAVLNNARRSGELLDDVDSEAEAGFLTAAVLGLFVMIRAKAPAAIVHGAVDSALSHLDSLRVRS
ncbi:MAG: TetR/AcrR family transcriptional regulator [Actinomycetota bacterium]